MKRWRRLVSSLLLACLLLGSGGSLVADAVSYWPDYDAFDLLNMEVLKMATGDKYFLPIDKTIEGLAAVKLPIPSGKTYRLDMICNFNVYSSSANIRIALFDSQMNVRKTLYSGSVAFSKKTFNFTFDGSEDLYFGVVINGNASFWWNSAGFVDQSTDVGILNSIKEGFQKLWDWLKGIWDSIKEIPTKIAASLTSLGDRIRDFFNGLGDRISGFFNDIWEKIKAFFLPSDGYFDDYSAEFNVFIDDHFGFLAQLPDELSLIVNTLITYEPSDPPFIDFPEVKLPLPGKTYTIVKQQRYTFDFLSDQPFSTLYTAYQGFVWLAYCLMLFNFLKHKYNVIFGGDGSAG